MSGCMSLHTKAVFAASCFPACLSSLRAVASAVRGPRLLFRSVFFFFGLEQKCLGFVFVKFVVLLTEFDEKLWEIQ